jgi:predicted GNAT family acetyltransferase
MLLHVFQNVKNTKLFTKESCSIQKDSQNFKKSDYESVKKL